MKFYKSIEGDSVISGIEYNSLSLLGKYQFEEIPEDKVDSHMSAEKVKPKTTGKYAYSIDMLQSAISKHLEGHKYDKVPLEEHKDAKAAPPTTRFDTDSSADNKAVYDGSFWKWGDPGTTESLNSTIVEINHTQDVYHDSAYNRAMEDIKNTDLDVKPTGDIYFRASDGTTYSESELHSKLGIKFRK